MLFLSLLVLATVLTAIVSLNGAVAAVMPIAIIEVGVKPQPLLMGVLVGAQAAFMMPFATLPNVMIYGPGGYHFGDFWKPRLLCVIWLGVVVVLSLRWFGSSEHALCPLGGPSCDSTLGNGETT